MNTRSVGSSPRGRGTHLDDLGENGTDRFIPAWAGNTDLHGELQNFQPVHPRVGGEHQGTPLESMHRLGSSPRGRGTHTKRQGFAVANRFIPAWAGNTDPRRGTFPTGTVHPRVGGEHRKIASLNTAKVGSSPRGRGTLLTDFPVKTTSRFIPAWAGNTLGRREAIEPDRRFIPAWAGNTRSSSCSTSEAPVHPRVGGEHLPWARLRFCQTGSSPRGRGTLLARMLDAEIGRFIPAWAGNTCQDCLKDRNPPVHPRVGGEHE